MLPLDGFEPMTLGIVWRGEPSPLVRAVMGEVQRYTAEAFPDWVVQTPLP
jgi:hypothetical protein